MEISPAELCFVYEHSSELRNVLHLRNSDEGRCLAFKVKCNNSSRYMVRPTSGIINPGAAINVKVYMVAQVAYTDELRSCKDRFLIQTVPVRSVSDAGLDPGIFSSPARQEAKINVTVVGLCLLKCFHTADALEGTVSGYGIGGWEHLQLDTSQLFVIFLNVLRGLRDGSGYRKTLNGLVHAAGSSSGNEECPGGRDQGICVAAGRGGPPPVHAQVSGAALGARWLPLACKTRYVSSASA